MKRRSQRNSKHNGCMNAPDAQRPFLPFYNPFTSKKGAIVKGTKKKFLKLKQILIVYFVLRNFYCLLPLARFDFFTVHFGIKETYFQAIVDFSLVVYLV